jgi:hypothetical protein
MAEQSSSGPAGFVKKSLPRASYPQVHEIWIYFDFFFRTFTFKLNKKIIYER